jgi:hypothetical protein
LAATWRLVGIWSLLLLPFGALALVRLAEWAAARLRAPGAVTLTALLLPAVLLLAVRDQRLIRTEMFNWETGTWRHDTEAGRAAVAELERLGGGRVVVDSLGNLDFLEVMVRSGAPRLFVTSADAPAPALVDDEVLDERARPTERGADERAARRLVDAPLARARRPEIAGACRRHRERRHDEPGDEAMTQEAPDPTDTKNQPRGHRFLHFTAAADPFPAAA